jgi:hypothetical protein
MRAALVLVLTLLCLSTAARADVHASKAGKVSVNIPTKWTVTPKDELVRAVSPDGEIAFVMWVVETTDTKTALKTLEGELYSSIQGLKWVDKVKKLKIGRLPATWVEGVGINGRGVQLDLLVVIAGPTPAKKGVIMFAAIEHDKLAANGKTIQAVFKSLKPTK